MPQTSKQTVKFSSSSLFLARVAQWWARFERGKAGWNSNKIVTVFAGPWIVTMTFCSHTVKYTVSQSKGHWIITYIYNCLSQKSRLVNEKRDFLKWHSAWPLIQALDTFTHLWLYYKMACSCVKLLNSPSILQMIDCSKCILCATTKYHLIEVMKEKGLNHCS